MRAPRRAADKCSLRSHFGYAKRYAQFWASHPMKIREWLKFGAALCCGLTIVSGAMREITSPEFVVYLPDTYCLYTYQLDPGAPGEAACGGTMGAFHPMVRGGNKTAFIGLHEITVLTPFTTIDTRTLHLSAPVYFVGGRYQMSLYIVGFLLGWLLGAGVLDALADWFAEERVLRREKSHSDGKKKI